MHLVDADRNEYNKERPVFIGACPDCGAEIDEQEDCVYNYDRHCEDGGYEIRWYCTYGHLITPDVAYTI